MKGCCDIVTPAIGLPEESLSVVLYLTKALSALADSKATGNMIALPVTCPALQNLWHIVLYVYTLQMMYSMI